MSFFSFFRGGAVKPMDIQDGVVSFRKTAGAVLLDVRTHQEYVTGHIPGSVNLPLSDLAKISFPKSTPLYVYCASGSRSSRATSWLQKHGYHPVNIGGIYSYHGDLKTGGES